MRQTNDHLARNTKVEADDSAAEQAVRLVGLGEFLKRGTSVGIAFGKRQRFARLPILLISGDSDPRVPSLALSSGANAWFPKPYSPSAVRRKLEELLC